MAVNIRSNISELLRREVEILLSLGIKKTQTHGFQHFVNECIHTWLI